MGLKFTEPILNVITTCSANAKCICIHNPSLCEHRGESWQTLLTNHAFVEGRYAQTPQVCIAMQLKTHVVESALLGIMLQLPAFLSVHRVEIEAGIVLQALHCPPQNFLALLASGHKL